MWLQSIFNNAVFDISTIVVIDAAISWSTQIIFDLLIFLFTLIRSLRMRREGCGNAIDILLRDGASDKLALLSLLTPCNERLGSLYFACVENAFI